MFTPPLLPVGHLVCILAGPLCLRNCLSEETEAWEVARGGGGARRGGGGGPAPRPIPSISLASPCRAAPPALFGPRPPHPSLGCRPPGAGGGQPLGLSSSLEWGTSTHSGPNATYFPAEETLWQGPVSVPAPRMRHATRIWI